jgi:hypothetical protein
MLGAFPLEHPMPNRFVLAAAFILVLVTVAPAQCIGDDNLVGPPGVPCCFPIAPLLPQFPSMLLSSSGACLLDCGVESSWPTSVFFTAPLQFFPDLYICQIAVGPPTPVPPSLAVLKYARTWMEAPGSGPRQVWRFLLNTDLVYSPAGAGASPCPTPACAGLSLNPPRPVHFMGHVDYAYDCNANAWSMCFSLTHLCGYFMHGPSSARPLPAAQAHADRSFAFVGPAPFTFGATPGMIGFLSADSQRSDHIDLNASPITWDCLREHAIAGSLCGGGPGTCPCTTSTSPGPLWSNFVVGFSEFCIGTVVSTYLPIPLPPYLPNGTAYLSLGAFGGAPGTFPGTRKVESWLGLTGSADPCQSQFFSLPFHVVHGVATYGDTPGTTFPNSNGTSATTDRFLDLENMLIPNSSAPGGAQMGIGSLFISSQVWGVCLV